MINQVSDAEAADFRGKGLYKVGGVATPIMAVFIPIQIIIFPIWPPPSTVIGWFTLFQNNRLLGLFDMDLLLIVDQVLMGLVLLALYTALRRTSQSFMAIALILGLVGIATYFASTSTFEMLSLSNQYAAATTEAQRSTFLAAGQAMLVNWQGTAFDVAYILEGVALLIIPADHRGDHATEQYLQQSDRLFGNSDGYIDISTASSRGDRSPLLARFSRAFGDMGHPDCPKAVSASKNTRWR